VQFNILLFASVSWLSPTVLKEICAVLSYNFKGHMPFLSPIKQHQITTGKD